MSGCIVIDGAIVCGTGRLYGRTVGGCPTCKCRRRMLRTWGGAWYGETRTCLGCGDAWSDGELHPRPFERAWREKAKTEAARRYYQDAVNWADYRRKVRASLRYALAGAA